MSQPLSLSVFARIINESGTGVVQFKEGSLEFVKSGGTYRAWNLLGRGLRLGSNKEANNKIRTELLRSLAVATGLAEDGGNFVLTNGIVDRLKVILGEGVLCAEGSDAFKVNDNGEVVSGSPLTERRITKILKTLNTDGVVKEPVEALKDYPKANGVKGKKVQKVTLGEVVRTQEQKLVASFKFAGRLDSKLKGDTFQDHLKRCLWDLGVTGLAPRSTITRKDPFIDEKQLKEARTLMIKGLQDPKRSSAKFYEGLALYNQEINRLGKAMLPGYKAVTPGALIAKLNASYDPEIAAKAAEKMAKVKERRAWLRFTGMVAAAGKLENDALVKDNEGIAVFRAIGDGMRSFGNRKPDLLAVYKGLSAAMDMRFEEPPLIDPKKTITNALATHSLRSKESIEALLTGLKNGDFHDEQAFLKAFSEEYPEGSRPKVNELRHTLTMALETIADSYRTTSFLSETGGSLQEPMDFEFERTFGSETYGFKSTVSPVEQKLDQRPVTNLMMSNLSVDNGNGGAETLVSFVRFGQVGCKTEPKDVPHAYRTLARTILMNNAELQDMVKNGATEVTVPIYRVDMSVFDENKMTLEGDPETLDAFEVDLGDGKSVSVKPEIHHFFVPVDTDTVYNPDTQKDDAMSIAQRERTNVELKKLLEYADDKLKDGKMSNENKKRIQALCASLKQFKNADMDPKKVMNVDSKNGYYRTKDWTGAMMLQFGSQVAMLASLLGKTPAINCNWGRDRTGLMDSEIKMLATKLKCEEEPDLTIDAKFVEAEQKKMRSEFLRDSGNAEIARQMFTDSGNINLHQGSLGVYYAFDEDIVNEPPNEVVVHEGV